jgi:hypothetical protein
MPLSLFLCQNSCGCRERIFGEPRVDKPDSTTATQARQAARHWPVQQRLVLLGIAGIFGGEAFCLLGPMRYERLVHFSCHAVFYTGVVFVCIGALLHWFVKRRR